MNLGVSTCFTLLPFRPWDIVQLCSLLNKIAAITRWVEMEGSFSTTVFLQTIMVESTSCCRWTLRNRLLCRTTDLDIRITHQMLQTGAKATITADPRTSLALSPSLPLAVSLVSRLALEPPC